MQPVIIQKSVAIPNQSMLSSEISYDYVDSFQSLFTDKGQPVSIKKVLALFMTGVPAWANVLMKIRDAIVRPFGWRTSDSIYEGRKYADIIKYEQGERIGIFKLFAQSDNELVLGEDDKHLSFRVSLLLVPVDVVPDQRLLAVTTVVRYHQLLGKLYFFPVKFFHRLIVLKTLEGIIHGIEVEPKMPTP